MDMTSSITLQFAYPIQGTATFVDHWDDPTYSLPPFQLCFRSLWEFIGGSPIHRVLGFFC